MKVWIIQVGEPMPTDPGRPRLWRSGLLAQHLVAHGHDVTWWASTFDHRTKTHRFAAEQRLNLGDGWSAILLHSPGYRHNVSLGRLRDHRTLGRRFRVAAEGELPPDVIHCAFPTIELSLEAARYGVRHHVPVVLDARDLWPEIFIDALPRPLRSVSKLLIRREFQATREAFALASAVSGHTEGFVDFGVRCARRGRHQLDRAFPFGYPIERPSAEEIAQAGAFWDSLGILESDSAPTVCFLGSFGVQKALDLVTPIHAARLLQARGVRGRFVLCGSGPRLEACRRAAVGVSNVVLPGWVGYPETWTLLRRSRVGLLPYLPAKDFALSIPNKAIEYLSGSLPILTSLVGGELEQALRAHDCGIFFKGGNPEALADAVQLVVDDPMRIEHMALRAHRLFVHDYAADAVYQQMTEHLVAVATAHASNRRAAGGVE
jgi:glycosyltransferase involved in cell wall biosynthesis